MHGDMAHMGMHVDARMGIGAMAPPVAPPVPQVIPVIVPQNLGPGMLLKAPIPDGRWIQLNVPENAGPGTVLHVRVPPLAPAQQAAAAQQKLLEQQTHAAQQKAEADAGVGKSRRSSLVNTFGIWSRLP